MKKFFGFGSSTPPPPPFPGKPPAPPAKRTPPAAPVPAIVGHWQEPGTSDTTEFRADGTVIERTGTGETIRGRYSLRNKQLKLDLDGVADDLSLPVAVGAETLEITDSEGKVTLYQRIS